MIRRSLLPGAVVAAMFCVGPGLLATGTADVSSSPSALNINGAQSSEYLRLSDSTAIYYDKALSESDVIARAQADADTLGLPLVKTLAAGRIVIVKGTEAETRSRLAVAEGIPAVYAGAAYALHGDINTRAIVAYTDRLLLRFSDDVSESSKEAFYAAHQLTRIREYGSGNVLVESSRTPDESMPLFAKDLLSGGAGVVGASADLILTGQQTANSDAIQIADPLFPFQWYLFNTVTNTNNGSGKPDEDLDVPRAWMINQRNIQDAPGATADTVYGDASIVVGVLDSGTEISHEDLAENIDGGFSSIGGQAINSGGGAIAAHGTVMAGLIAAAKNSVGIVGVAPGVKLYSLKIFANDLSTSTIAISQAVDATVSAGVDINVHPYSLSLNDDDSGSASVENSLRRSFESGRGGLGTINFAAAGNSFTQVEYPAHSRWCVAVGSVSADGYAADGDNSVPEMVGLPRSNWGGKGIDLVMPSYVVAENSAPNGSSGIVSTDLTASSGVSSPSPNLVGNESGNYTVIGPLNQFVGTSAASLDTATRYKGTSVSTALAGAVAALMLSDERYSQLSPFINGSDTLSRQGRRDRAPLRGSGNDANILSMMKNYSDLPGGNDLRYIDQHAEFYGFGRPNPARALSLPGFDSDTSDSIPAGSNVTPDYMYRSYLLDPPVYEVKFDSVGVAGDNEVDGADDTLGKGWHPTDGGQFSAQLGSTGPVSRISPYLEGLSTIYFEDGTTVDAGQTDGGDQQYFYVWTDSVTTAPANSEQSTAANNLAFNPLGRYYQNRVVEIESPVITAPAQSSPMVLDIQIAHELGGENSSSDGLRRPADRTAAVYTELDNITMYVDPLAPDPFSPDPPPFAVASITGDSTGHSKIRLTPAAVIAIPNGSSTSYVPSWPGVPSNKYEPYVSDDQMVVRTYSYYVRPLPPGTVFRLVLQLNPGESYLPSYSRTAGPPVTYSQLNNVRRDMKGFIFYGAKLSQVRPDYVDYLNDNLFELSDGQFPTWSASAHDVMLSRLGFGGGDSFLIQADPEQSYQPDPTQFGPPFSRPNITLTKTNGGETITGLRSHPSQEIMAMTTTSPSGEFVYTITTDGVQQTRIIDPSLTIGARDASWSPSGSQLVYASHDYIRIASLQDDGTWSVETVMSTDSPATFLEDFHSPLFDPLSGVIYFTARRRDPSATDNSLQIFLSTRVGRIISYNADPRSTLVAGWEGVDIFDLEVSRSGLRLIFSANASATPEVDPMTGEVLTPATPSSACRLFTIENFKFIVNYNDPPIYNEITLQSRDAGYPKVSARWPRISPNSQEIVWQAFNTPVNVDSGTGNGRIVRQPIGFQESGAGPQNDNPTPPTPGPPPTGTPPDPTQAHVTYDGGYDFGADQQGWEFRNAGTVYDAPVTSYENIDSFPSEVVPGRINFVASSANPINGTGVRVATLNFNALQAGNTALNFLATNPNRTHVLDINSQEVPSTTENGTVGISSRGGPSVRLYLSPSASNSNVGSPVTVDILMDTNGLSVTEVYGYIGFSPSALRFVSGSVNGTEFERIRGFGRLTMTATSTNTFGYAESATSSIIVQPDSMYLYRAYISATEGTAADRVPTIRIRVNSSNLESFFSSEVNSLGDLSISPNATAPKAVDLLFQPPAEIFTLPLAKRRYSMAFDLLNFISTDDPRGGVTLNRVEVYRLDNAPTKSVITNPEVVFQTDFATQAERSIWKAGPFLAEFSQPEFLQFPSSLVMRVQNKSNTFGYWTADGNSIPSGTVTINPAAPTVIYRATFVLKNEQEANPLLVPDYRVRIASNDFQRSAASSLISLADGSTVPLPGKPRTLTTFLVLEEVPADFNAFVAAFDVLSFYPGRTITDKPLECDSIKIERVYIPGYPATR